MLDADPIVRDTALAAVQERYRREHDTGKRRAIALEFERAVRERRASDAEQEHLRFLGSRWASSSANVPIEALPPFWQAGAFDAPELSADREEFERRRTLWRARERGIDVPAHLCADAGEGLGGLTPPNAIRAEPPETFAALERRIADADAKAA